MAILRVLRGANVGEIFPLVQDSTVLGRQADCDIVLPVPAVSRQHARIFRDGSEYFIEDLRSRNKTYLNDVILERPAKLSDQDRIRICDVEFVFHSSDSPALWGDPGRDPTASLVEDESLETSSTIMLTRNIQESYSAAQVAIHPAAKLKALIAITQSLARAVALNEVLPKVLEGLFVAFPHADRGFILLKDPKTGKLTPRAVKQRREDSRHTLRLSRTILNAALTRKEAILSADAATDSRFDNAQSIVDFQIHSVMCAPLISSDGEVLGAIQIDTSDQRLRFTEEDLEVLASVAYQAAVAVENAQLHEIALEQAEIRREMAVAQRLQQGFLPAAPPEIGGYAFYDFYDPAKELGGDYFAYVPLGSKRWAIVVADVSGKGLSAALLVARLSAETPQILLTEPTAAHALARLNELFCESRWEDRFVTMAVIVLEPERHEMVVASAGHLPPLMRRASGELVRVGESITGLPLGVGPGFTYHTEVLSVGFNDSIVLYTDGIPEAMNAKNEVYGFERLERLIKNAPAKVESLGERLIADVRQFVGNRSQSDDMCLVCFGRVA